MTRKIGNGSIPLRIGRLIDTTVYGGPYRDVPDLFWGVKMAEEIDFPHMVDIPTKDYCVPEVSDLKAGIVKSLMAMINEENVYAGCWGGIGRTGLFLAALAKVQIEYRKSKHRAGRGDDPVLYVRKHFIPHAVETAEQKQFIDDLDVSDIVSWLDATQTAMGLGGLTPAREPVRAGQTVRTAGPVHLNRIPFTPTKEWIPEEDKIDNPAFDRYEADWKSRRNSRPLDWIDSPDADSADKLLEEDAWVGAIDDLNRTVEDLSERLELAEGNIISLETLYSLVKEGINSLTNATISGKIRRLFK